MKRSDRRWKSMVISLALFVVSAAVFWPACANGFVDLDDEDYVASQPGVLNGLTWNGLLWAMTASVAANWHPLTLVSLQLDAQFFGSGPMGFHRTSVLIHAANAALVFLMLCALTGSLLKSTVVAILFSLHPLRVESVAWISERKDLLSGFFFCLTILTYVHYVAAPSRSRYLLVAMALGLGLCAKPMLVTTPCVLLLLDFWPLARLRRSLSSDSLLSPGLDQTVNFECHGAGGASGLRDPRCDTVLKLLIEKIPLFGLVAFSSLMTVVFQSNAIKNLSTLSLTTRIENAVVSYVAYLWQTIWPVGLAGFYSIRTIPVLQFVAAAALLLVITVIVVQQRDRRPYLLVGWFWFFGMLIPVCGLIQVGDQARADRYTYLPHIGLFAAVVWAAAELIQQSRGRKILAMCLSALCVSAYIAVTTEQISLWKNAITHYRRIYECNSGNYECLLCLVDSLINEDHDAEAIQLTHEGLAATDVSDSVRMVALAMHLVMEGEYDACIQALSMVLQHHPNHPNRAELYSNRGKAEAALGRWEDAAADYRQAAKLSPRSPTFQFYLAHALGKTGHREEANEIYGVARKMSPEWAQQALSSAWRMSTSPKRRDRVEFWPVCLAEQAIESMGGVSPTYLDVLSAAYAQSGRFNDAIAVINVAIQQAEVANDSLMAAELKQRLALYERHQPYRQSIPKL